MFALNAGHILLAATRRDCGLQDDYGPFGSQSGS